MTRGIFTSSGQWVGNLTHFRRLAPVLLCALVALLPATAAANVAPVVDSFVALPAAVLPGGTVTFTIDAHDPDCLDVCTEGCGTYIRHDLIQWSASGGSFLGSSTGGSASPFQATAEWEAPTAEGIYTISVFLADSGGMLCGGSMAITPTIDVTVSNNPNQPPTVDQVDAVPPSLLVGELSDLSCAATDPEGGPISYSWSADSGSITPTGADTAVFTAADPGIVTVTCTATDDQDASGTGTVLLSVTGAAAEASLSDGLSSPKRLDVTSWGDIYVADPRSGGISAVNLLSGSFVHRLPLPGVISVAVTWNDDLLVADASGARVIGRSGQVMRQLDPGEALGRIADVAVDKLNQRFGVLHRKTGRVVVYDSAGTVVTAFGATGDEAERFKSPAGLAATPAGEWVVADSGHGLIKIFDAAGTLLQSFGGLGGGVGEFVKIDDVVVDELGNIYASDAFQDWVQAFNPDGSVRETFGTYGADVGQFMTVAGLAVSADFDRLVAASLNGASLQVFRTSVDAPVDGPAAEAALQSSSPGWDPDLLSLTFGSQAVGNAGPAQTVELLNIGDAPLGITEVVTTGDFSQSNNCGAFVDPGQACSLEITFTPQAAGARVGAMVIRTSGLDGDLTVQLFGEGFVPPSVSITPIRLDFGEVPVGQTSPAQEVFVTNNGTAPLDVRSVQAAGDFVHNNGCSGQVAGGATCKIKVSFAPQSAADPALGTLSIGSLAAGSPHMVSLRGVGVADPAGLGVSDCVAGEGDGAAYLTVALTEPAVDRILVDYLAVADEASEGEDFLPTSGTLVFESGQQELRVTVPLINDQLLEPDVEVFRLELSNPVGATITDAVGEVSLQDDERCEGPNLLVNGDGETVDGNLSVHGWQVADGGTWTTLWDPANASEGAGVITAVDGELTELVQDVDLSFLAAAIDSGGQQLIFAAQLRSAVEERLDVGRIVVEYRDWANSNPLATWDSGPVASAGAWQQVSDERIVPTGTTWARVRLIATRRSGGTTDVSFDAITLRSLRAALVWADETTVYEGDGGASELVLPVHLSCAYYQDTALAFATSDGSAEAGRDYVSVGGAAALPAGETLGRIRIPVVPDLVDESHEDLRLRLEVVGPSEVKAIGSPTTGWLFNDDFCAQPVEYWLARTEPWPVTSLVIGGVFYDQRAIENLLRAPGETAAEALARQLAGALINLDRGSDPGILATVHEAELFLTQHPPWMDVTGADEDLAWRLAAEIEAYNRGGCSP